MLFRLSLTSILILLLISSNAFADRPVSWGDVSEEEWEIMSFPDDDEAKAIILSDFGESYFSDSGNAMFRRHVRIKILDPDESDYTDVVLRIVRADRAQSLSRLRAQTINRDENGREQVDQVRRRDINSERDGSFEITRFSFPNVQRGSIVEYSYQVMSRHRIRVEPWYFQHDEPILHSEYRVLIPREFTFRAFREGFESFDVDETEEVGLGFRFYADTYSSTENNYHRFVLKNAPAIRSEPYITSTSNYKNKVEFTLVGYIDTRGLQTQYMSNWNQIAAELDDAHRFSGQMRANRSMRNKVAELTDGLTSDGDKARAIYDFVAGDIVWNERFSFMAIEPSGVRDAFEDNTGSSGEKALMLIAFLREADVDAVPVLVSLRAHGYVNWANPRMDHFNHLIVKVNLEEGTYLLDPIVPEIPFGMLFPQSLNYDGLIIRDGLAEQVDIDPQIGSTSQVIGVAQLEEDGTLDVQFQIQRSGYEGIVHRLLISDYGIEDYLMSRILNDRDNTELVNHELNNLNDPEEVLQTQMHVIMKDFAASAGDMMYVNPFALGSITSNPFSNPVRNFPVEYIYGTENNYMITIQLPEGFEIEHVPESRMVQVSDHTAYILQVSPMGNNIQVSTRFVRGDIYFEADRYEDLRSFYGDIVEIHEEQIVLTRISDTEPEASSDDNGEEGD